MEGTGRKKVGRKSLAWCMMVVASVAQPAPLVSVLPREMPDAPALGCRRQLRGLERMPLENSFAQLGHKGQDHLRATSRHDKSILGI